MMRKEKHYVKSDGNGGFLVSKSIAFLTVVTLLLTILSSVIFATTYTVTNREKIYSLEQGYEDCKFEIKENHNSISRIDTNVAIIGAQMSTVNTNIEDLKTDFKEFMKDYHNE